MKFRKITSSFDKHVYVQVADGHFATNHSHINTYVDLTEMKTCFTAAKRAAVYLARQYQNIPIETILCLEGTNMLGAFFAEELGSDSNLMGMNRGVDIHVLTPELNSNKQMIFQHNTRHMIDGRQIILFLASISTAKTINRAVDCLRYYNGKLVGIAAGFSAMRAYEGIPIHALLTEENLPAYASYLPQNCEICRQGRRVDAIVNETGFMEIG